MASPDEQTRRAAHAAQDQLGRFLTKSKRAKRTIGVPFLTDDPPFASGINMWIHTDGGLRWYDAEGNVFEATKTAGGTTSSSTGFPADPQPVTTRTAYEAQWARTFCDQHGVETGSALWYGDSADGAHTGRKVMIGFDDATIRSDLSGATVEQVELHMLNLDGHASRLQVHWGLHNRTATPSGYSAVWADAAVLEWPQSGAGEEWRDVSAGVGVMLRDDLAKGLTIDQPPGFLNAGQFDWASVELRITYTV